MKNALLINYLLLSSFGLIYAYSQVDYSSRFTEHDLSFKKVQNQGIDYDFVVMPLCNARINTVGAPDLPIKVLNLLIPPQAKITDITVAETTSINVQGQYYLVPAQPPKILDNQQVRQFAIPDPVFYNSTNSFPGQLAEISSISSMAGYQIVTVNLYPLQYSAAAKQLVLFSSMTISIHYTDFRCSKFCPVRRSESAERAMVKTIKCAVDNPLNLSLYDGQTMLDGFANKPLTQTISTMPSLSGSTVDYVIITSEQLAGEFQRLADWKTKKGVRTVIRTVEAISEEYAGCDIQEKIRCFIQDAYRYWGTVWVLLGGDVNHVPTRTTGWGCFYGPMITDVYYADIVHYALGYEYNWNADGNHIIGEIYCDSVEGRADLFVGRAPAENCIEARTFIDKVMLYEKTFNAACADSLLFMTGTVCGTNMAILNAESIIQDVLSGQVDTAKIKEIYNPQNGYDPCYPPYYWSGDGIFLKATALSELNRGNNIVYHCDHCSPYSFGTGVEPSGWTQFLYCSDIMNLNNEDRPSILITIGCEPNRFTCNCVSEAFMNNPHGGCVAFIGNTVEGILDQCATLSNFYANLYDNDVYNIGNLYAISSPYSYLTGVLSMNLLGDPEMPIWTGACGFLTAEHADTTLLSDTLFSITIHGLSDGDTALVCLQKAEEIYARRFVGYPDTNVTLVIKPYTPGNLDITITCHNYLTYESICSISTISGPHLYPHSFFIFDDSVKTWGPCDGNKDGIMNPGETVMVYVNVGNSGNDAAASVIARLRTEDTLVSVADSVMEYGPIPPGVAYYDTISGSGFGIYCKPHYAYSLLEQHQVPVEITIESGDSVCRTWRYPMILNEHADTLSYCRHRLTGDTTILVYPEIANSGMGSARGVMAILRGGSNSFIEDSTSYFGEVRSNQSKLNESDPFVIRAPLGTYTITVRDTYAREWTKPIAFESIDSPDTIWTIPDENRSDLNWAYVGNTKPGSLAGYYVYRSEQASGVYEALNKIPITGTSSFSDRLLPEWRDYYYRVTAIDTFGNESAFSPTVVQRPWPKYQDGFPANILVGGFGGLGAYYSSIVTGDVNLDNQMEIAFGASGRVYLFNAHGEILPGWPVYLGDFQTCSSPALTDVNGDDTLETIIGTGGWVGSNDGLIHCLDIHGAEASGWPVCVSASVFASPVIADIDGDGAFEILICARIPAQLFAFELNGELVPGFPLITSGVMISETPAVADFDCDGKEEILLQTRRSPTGNLLMLKYDTDLEKIDTMPGWPKVPDAYSYLPWLASPIIGDIDSDSIHEVIAAVPTTNTVCCFEPDGTIKWEYNIGARANCGLAMGDINLDGCNEIVFAACDDQVYVLSDRGLCLWKKTLPFSGTWARTSAGIAIGNIDEDPYHEILLSSKDWLFVLNHDGTVMNSAPFLLEGDGHLTPCIGDFDADGEIDIIGVSGGDCMVKVWDLPVPASENPWPMFQHDAHHSGRFHAQSRGSISINGNADTTYSRTVTLHLIAQSESLSFEFMKISDDEKNSGWIPYDTHFVWTLPDEDGNKKVLAAFKDVAGHIFYAADDIFKWTIDAVLSINDSQFTANFRIGLVTITVERSEGEADSLRIGDNDSLGNWVPYKPHIINEFSLGNRQEKIAVQLKDKTNNISTLYVDSIILDTLKPTGTIIVPPVIGNYIVQCTLDVADDTDGVILYRLGNMPLLNIVPNGDFSDSSCWQLIAGNIHDGYAQLYRPRIVNTKPLDQGVVLYQNMGSNTFAQGITYRLSLDCVTNNIKNASISIVRCQPVDTNNVMVRLPIPDGCHVYSRESLLCDTFTPYSLAAFGPYRICVHIDSPEASDSIEPVIYINTLKIEPVLPHSLFGPWSEFYPTPYWQLPGGDSMKIVYAQFLDNAGNSVQVCDTTFVILSQPVGTVTIDQSAEVTNSSAVVLNLWTDDTTSRMQVSNASSLDLIENAGFSYELDWWQDSVIGAASIYTDQGEAYLSAGDWTQPGRCQLVQYIDASSFALSSDSSFTLNLSYAKSDCGAGFGGFIMGYNYCDNVSESICIINFDPTDTLIVYSTTFSHPPDSTKTLASIFVEIAASTEAAPVNIRVDRCKLGCGANATQLSDWEPYKPIRLWRLEGKGNKAVYAWFKNTQGTISKCIGDTIMVDPNYPINDGLTVNNGDLATNCTYVNLDFTYDLTPDSVFIWDVTTISPWSEPKTTVRWQLGEDEGWHTVHAISLNRARNIAIYFYDSIQCDFTPPEITCMFLNHGAEYTMENDIECSFSAYDNMTGPATLRLGNEWSFGYSIIENGDFSSSDGWKTDGQYAKIENGHAEIPSVHLERTPASGFSFIEQEIDMQSIIEFLYSFKEYGIDTVKFTITMDAICNDFSGDANVKIICRYLSGAQNCITVLNIPQNDRVYWGKNNLQGQFTLAPEMTLTDITIRIDIPFTHGQDTPNNGCIWIDNVEMQLSGPDSMWTDWKAYQPVLDWRLCDSSGQRSVCGQITDSAGNKSISMERTITLDPEPPVSYLNLPRASSDTIVCATLYVVDHTSGVDSVQFANFPFVNYVKNAGFDSDSHWILDGLYAKIADGYAELSMVRQPDSSLKFACGYHAFIEQFISADSLDAQVGDTLSLSLNMIVSNFSGKGTIELTYCYDDWMSEENSGIIIDIPTGDTQYLDFRKFGTNFCFWPDTFRFFTGVKIHISTGDIPNQCMPLGLGSGHILIDNVTLQKLPSSQAYSKWQQYCNYGTPDSMQFSWTIPSGEGERSVYARTMDRAGNKSTVAWDIMDLDTISPQNCAIIANQDSKFTNNTLVDLELSGTDNLSGISEMYLSNHVIGNILMNGDFKDSLMSWNHNAGVEYDNGCAVLFHVVQWGCIWQYIDPCNISMGSLESEYELHAHVKLSSPADLEVTFTVSYLYDDSSNETVSEKTILASGDTCWQSISVAQVYFPLANPGKSLLGVKISANSFGSINGEISINEIKLTLTSQYWIQFAHNYEWTLPSNEGSTVVYAQFRDYAGNLSVTYSDTIVLDTTPPQARILSPVDGSFLTPRDSLTIYGTAGDVNFSCYRLADKRPNCPLWFPVRPDSHSTIPVDSGFLGYWNTTRYNGVYYLCITVTDSAANVSAETIMVNFAGSKESLSNTDSVFVSLADPVIDMAVDAEGNMYVLSERDSKIIKLDNAGAVNRSFNCVPDRNCCQPYSADKLIVDDSGHVWTADTKSSTIYVLENDCKTTRRVELQKSRSNEAAVIDDITVGNSGFLFIYDRYKHSVFEFNRHGKFVAKIPVQVSINQCLNKNLNLYEPNEKDGNVNCDPGKIIVSNGLIRVISSKTKSIVILDTCGDFVRQTTANSFLNLPADYAISTHGSTVIADSGSNRIFELDPWGNLLLVVDVDRMSHGVLKCLEISKDGACIYYGLSSDNTIWKLNLRMVSENDRQNTALPDEGQMTKTLELFNCPNPFSGFTVISCRLPDQHSILKGNEKCRSEDRLTSLKVFDSSGRLVRDLTENMFTNIRDGESRFTWDAKDNNGMLVNSGVYFCYLETADKKISKKMIITRK